MQPIEIHGEWPAGMTPEQLILFVENAERAAEDKLRWKSTVSKLVEVRTRNVHEAVLNERRLQW